jgi:hypothetical protein
VIRYIRGTESALKSTKIIRTEKRENPKRPTNGAVKKYGSSACGSVYAGYLKIKPVNGFHVPLISVPVKNIALAFTTYVNSSPPTALGTLSIQINRRKNARKTIINSGRLFNKFFFVNINLNIPHFSHKKSQA